MTGCTSSTLARSSSVSTLVESLATSEESKVEVILTEDLLYNACEHGKEVHLMRIDIMKRKLKKFKGNNKVYNKAEKLGKGEPLGHGNEEEAEEDMVEKLVRKQMVTRMIREILRKMMEDLVERADVTGRGADHEILRESSASRDAGLRADPVVLAEEPEVP